MEPILKDVGHSGTVKGVEVLFFEEAEIRKIKGNSPSFASLGSLSVLYFKDYNRFVLKLNDWRYPLMRRLPISATGQNDVNNRVYTLPALNGFSYELRINKIGSSQALTNFETILGNNAGFSFKGNAPLKQLEASPDDKLSRATLNINKDTGLKEVISHAISHASESIKHAAKSLHPGSTKTNTSTKKKQNLNEIKTKDFKKDAHSTLKKDFFEHHAKASQDFLNRRHHNPNLSNASGFDDLRKTSDHNAPVLYLPREEIEEAILNNKDLIKEGIKI